MATRTAHDFTGGETPAAAVFDGLPGGWLGWIESTSDQTGITSEVDVTSVTLTVTVNASRRIKISVGGMVSAVTNDAAAVGRINKDGSNAGTWCRTGTITAGNDWQCFGSWIDTPSTGSHIYKATIARSSGTGTITVSGTSPGRCWILVEDIGPAS